MIGSQLWREQLYGMVERKRRPSCNGRVFEKKSTSEVNLLSQGDNNTLKAAVKILCAKLDAGKQTLSALDFHFAVQKDSEAVADYI